MTYPAHRSPTRAFITLILLVTIAPAAPAQPAAELNSRGAELYEQRRWAEAADHFRRAYEADSRNEVIQQNLMNAAMMYAQHLYDGGSTEKAYDWLKLAIRAVPTNPRPLNQLGAYYLHEGEIQSAIFRLEESIELQPGSLESHFLLGMAYYKDNDVTAAIDQWEYVYRKNKNYPGLMNRLEDALREEQVEYGFEGDASRNFKVTYDTETGRQQVNDVLNILEEAYREFGRTFGGLYPPTPIQVSLYTAEGFSDSTQQGEHVAALYDGTKIRCPVIDRDGKQISRPILRERLRHEYIHVIVRHAVRDRAPWWFNEGLAEAMSSQIDRRRKAALKFALENDRLFALEQISPSNTLATLSPEQLEIAYAQSHLTMKILYDRHGPRGVTRMFDALNGGLSGENALKKAYRTTHPLLESQVREAIPQQ